MEAKTFCKAFFGLTAVLLSGIGLLTIYVDPFFHYHKPLSGFAYQLRSGERYLNDGITRHFDYDAVITGTSMTENFKTSELDRLFGVHAIKVPYAGGRYKEVNDNLRKAFTESGNGIKIVVRGLDLQLINADKDEKREDIVYPDYLVNDNFFDDVRYLFNKDVFFQETVQTCILTAGGYAMKSFDAYSNWMQSAVFGKDHILQYYPERKGGGKIQKNKLTEEDRLRIAENLSQNVTSVIRENPQCEFYYFFPPYSILWYHSEILNGGFYKNYEIEKIAIETLLAFENVRLYSWNDQFDLTTNLDLYRDATHYHEDINSQMLSFMKAGKGRLTVDNYETYLQKCYRFYSRYDYERIFAPEDASDGQIP